MGEIFLCETLETQAADLPVLHRLREVRMQEHVSLRAMAIKLRADRRAVRQQEEGTADLRLSELYQWRDALDVPIQHLLVDADEPLSRPVRERASMVRVMKTAKSILERAPSEEFLQIARLLVEQLTDVMPELRKSAPGTWWGNAAPWRNMAAWPCRRSPWVLAAIERLCRPR
jgi:transcriptional regulator with XRE-family HTH domain